MSNVVATPAIETPLRRFAREFAGNAVAVVALAVVIVLAVAAIGSPWIAPQNPYDLAQISILDHLLPPGEPGRRFLLGHGERHGAMWRECCAALRQAGAVPATLAGMLAGAQEAFAEFEAWFAAAPQHSQAAANR